jgi:glycosyltransferase involved in cell wall biosynthesis
MIPAMPREIPTRGRTSWHIITGEFPPQKGGVSDHTSLLAAALSGGGEEIHVWAPPAAPAEARSDGVQVHRLSGRFDLGSLKELGAGLDAFPLPRRLFLQYVPDGFGCRAMNLPFCLWVARRRAESVWVLYHEYAYLPAWGAKFSHNVRAVVTSSMGAILAARADRIFVSTPAWEQRIPGTLRASRSITWLPTPSNVPPAVSEESVVAVRHRVTGGAPVTVIGHFGTFGQHIAHLLEEVLHPSLMGRPERRCLLIGRGGEAFASALRARFPMLSGQVMTTGGLPTEAIASHIKACDILIQPYQEGATTRRGTLMAGLSLGMPIVTNLGHSSEPVWKESGALDLAGDSRPETIVAAVEGLLSSPGRWQELGKRAASLYAERFSLERSLQTLRRLAREEDEREEGGRGDRC